MHPIPQSPDLPITPSPALPVSRAPQLPSPRAPHHPRTPAPQPRADALSGRELAILRLMAANLSHREIAEELYLSVNTVKWYSTHIYGKLGVHRQADAVARARELGILS